MKKTRLNKKRIYELITVTLIIIMDAGTLIVAPANIITGQISRILTILLMFPVILFPYILNKTKYKLSELETLLFYTFIFLAQFLGCVLDLYNYISWYDLFVHFLSGIFTYLLALAILKRLKAKPKIINRVLFCLGIVCIIIVFWEIFEFTGDRLLNLNLQHYIETGVFDTMEDMIAAFLGGVVALIVDIFLQRKIK